MKQAHWLDRLTGSVAPLWTLRRQRARIASELILRNYEGASSGRRTQGWKRSSTDANQATGPFMQRLREAARDLVRNNPYAEGAISTIADHVVEYGILPTPRPSSKQVRELWREWAETKACDADGQHDFYGLQKLVMRTIAESGAALIRRRLRREEDGLPIPLQIQVMEPDFIDISKDSLMLNTGGARIVQGIEFDAIGRRSAYWLFREHPGSAFATTDSVRVPAESVLHVFDAKRAGQVHGVSWFAPVLLKFKDFDDYDDATLMKQKIAACLAVVVTDTDGTNLPLGTADTTKDPQIDQLQPGAILNLQPGREVEVVQPPTVREYADYAKTQQRAIATGLGVTYEDLTGDYGNLPFSAARMSRLRHQSRVNDWRWKILIPNFCDPVWRWFAEVATVFGTTVGDVEWTAPPMPMIDPVNEGLAFTRNVRSGACTYSEALRERGYNPEDILRERAADNKRLDELEIILDSDPRYTTQSGQLQGEALPEPAPAAAAGAPAAKTDPNAEPDPNEEDDSTPTRHLHLVRHAPDGLASGYEVQTTYGYHHTGRWGHASYHISEDEAIRSAGEHSDCRVVNLLTGEIVWPKAAAS